MDPHGAGPLFVPRLSLRLGNGISEIFPTLNIEVKVRDD